MTIPAEGPPADSVLYSALLLLPITVKESHSFRYVSVPRIKFPLPIVKSDAFGSRPDGCP